MSEPERPANDEMVEGYRDGYDLDLPEPSTNRSASYRHGFMIGRGEKLGTLKGSCQAFRAAADKATDEDDKRSLPI